MNTKMRKERIYKSVWEPGIHRHDFFFVILNNKHGSCLLFLATHRVLYYTEYSLLVQCHMEFA